MRQFEIDLYRALRRRWRDGAIGSRRRSETEARAAAPQEWSTRIADGRVDVVHQRTPDLLDLGQVS